MRCWLAHQSELDQEDLHSTHGSDLTYYDPIAQVAAATRRQEEAEAAALAAETAAVEADALDATDPYVAAVPAGTPQRRRPHTAPNEPLEPWGTGEDAAGQADVGGRWGGPTASARSPLPVPRRPDHAAPHERRNRPHPASPAVQHGAARTPSSAATAAEAASGDVVGALKAFPGRSRTAASGRADNAPQLTPEQQVWVDRRQRSHVTDRWGHWEECHDADTGDVFYFNHKKLTGVLHKDQTDHPTVIPLSQRVRGKEQWAREDPQFEQDGTAKAWKAATKKFVKRQQRNALRENVARQREQLAESTSRTRRHGLREAQQHRRAHKLRVHQAQMEERAEHMLNLRHKQATIRAMNEAVRPATVGGSPRYFATDTPCCCVAVRAAPPQSSQDAVQHGGEPGQVSRAVPWSRPAVAATPGGAEAAVQVRVRRPHRASTEAGGRRGYAAGVGFRWRDVAAWRHRRPWCHHTWRRAAGGSIAGASDEGDQGHRRQPVRMEPAASVRAVRQGRQPQAVTEGACKCTAGVGRAVRSRHRQRGDEGI